MIDSILGKHNFYNMVWTLAFPLSNWPFFFGIWPYFSYFAAFNGNEFLYCHLTLQGSCVNNRMDNISFLLHSSALPIERTWQVEEEYWGDCSTYLWFIPSFPILYFIWFHRLFSCTLLLKLLLMTIPTA